jgi:hypothetical protein
MFTDSIEENIEILQMLVRDLPPQRNRDALRAAMHFENLFTRLQKDYPNDMAVALGVAFAVFQLANRMVQQAKEGDKSDQKGLIQLLNS